MLLCVCVSPHFGIPIARFEGARTSYTDPTHTHTHRHTHHWSLVVCASDCRLRLHRRIPDGIRRFSTLRTLIRNGHTNARRPDPVASAYIPLPILGWCRRSFFVCCCVVGYLYIFTCDKIICASSQQRSPSSIKLSHTSNQNTDYTIILPKTTTTTYPSLTPLLVCVCVFCGCVCAKSYTVVGQSSSDKNKYTYTQ